MNKFLDYFDPAVPLQTRLQMIFAEMEIPEEQRKSVAAFIEPLKIKDLPTYEHSIRVGILSAAIAKVMRLDEKALLYAGLLHDVGKIQTNPATLKKTEGWTEADTAEVKKHVLDGYRLVRGKFDFSAEIILWHHRFQSAGYPKRLPKPLHDYCRGTNAVIPMFGRMLALADCFDALHRVNGKFGDASVATGEAIKAKMFELNRDQRALIQKLYDEHIFTTRIISPA